MRTRRAPDGSIVPRLREFIDRVATSSPARFAILIFTALILVFTALLALPIASASGTATPVVDALFTAVSSICVTGLSTVDMATHWSTFGNVVVLLGIEIGGIGVMTLASMLGFIASRKLGLRARLMAASDSNAGRLHIGPVSESQAIRLGEIGGLLTTVAISVLSIELVLTAMIVPRLMLAGSDLWQALWEGFYFATSAFTNTGFVPHTSGLESFTTDHWMLGTIGLGVFIGSLGFPVIFALARRIRKPGRLPIHVKLTLVTTVVLTVVGAVALYALEWNNPATLGAQNGTDRPSSALFLSVMTRSGGFSNIPIGDMHGASLLITDMLMFVGGGSASTAGGIKVTTLAVLFLAAVAEARGNKDMQAFGRRIPTDVLRLAVSVVLWGATIVAIATAAIMEISKAPLQEALFDVISAFATCGLSTGLTETLPDAGKIVLMATMWAGRVGTVTLAAALAAKHRPQEFRQAEERPIVG